MKVVQYWVYNPEIPEYIKLCIESLNKYAVKNEIEHILVLDERISIAPEGEYKIVSIDHPQLDDHKINKLKRIASKVDYLRYKLLSVFHENLIYLDADFYFTKDPFDLLSTNDKSKFFHGGTKWVCNGIISAVPNCPVIKEILERSDRILDSLTEETNEILTLGPDVVMTPAVYGNKDKVEIHTDLKHFFTYGYSTLLDVCRGHLSEEKAKKLIESPVALASHMYKTHSKRNHKRDEENLVKWIYLLKEQENKFYLTK